jgi:hypothetical protein
MKWLENKCRESNTFAWIITVIGIGLMFLIAGKDIIFWR